MTACKHAMASTSNPEAVQIAHMTQRNFLQSAASLARTIQYSPERRVLYSPILRGLAASFVNLLILRLASVGK
ncbi:hypothetical protein V6Z11_A07G264800 [Gossypium hirsutum]